MERQDSHLFNSRSFTAGGVPYSIKDIHLGVFQHEWERAVAFLAEPMHADQLFFSGKTTNKPGIRVGTRFVPESGGRGKYLYDVLYGTEHDIFKIMHVVPPNGGILPSRITVLQ